jgi:hypothetical protein
MIRLPDSWDGIRALLDGCVDDAERALFVAIKRNRGPVGRDALLAQIDALETVRGAIHAGIDTAAGAGATGTTKHAG